MRLRIRARTVLQLGAELISSDAIAFYELIKNAFDAGSPRVVIDVFADVPNATLVALRQELLAERDRPPERDEHAAREKLQASRAKVVDLLATAKRKKLGHALASARAAETHGDLLRALDEVSIIVVADKGHGMSRAGLSDIFLEIGTPFRLEQRAAHKGARVLGEKGLGRLSSMRLGWSLTVRTSQAGEANWHILDIDWGAFIADPNAYLEDIDIPSPREEAKEDASEHGTTITIRRLLRDWVEDDLKEISSTEFSRLTDPFTPEARYPITLRFNGGSAILPRKLSSEMLSWAHAHVEATFVVEPTLRYFGSIQYRVHNVEESFDLGENELLAIANATPRELAELGPFQVSFYWYNRRILEAVEGFGTKADVQKVVKEWANGLMVFRDGFRVNPYGGSEDDWLDLDKKALGSSGYKVNRHQILGKLDISSSKNPALLDQTNREGLRATPEFAYLRRLLQHVIWTQFKALLNRVDATLAPQISLTEIGKRVDAHGEAIGTAVERLAGLVPEDDRDDAAVEEVEIALKQIAGLMTQARSLADQYEDRRDELIHLAGLGLMVEIIAHELNRTTHHALALLGDLDAPELSATARTTITLLRAQLKTLNTRLRVLDPLATTGRNRKERFDLSALVRDVVEAHRGQAERLAIRLRAGGPMGAKLAPFSVSMVKGMIVQVMENLITNSMYWLQQQRRRGAAVQGEIEIIVDSVSRTVAVSDSGPGVMPALAERVFEPFFTTKPPDLGRGLGLYISREIAQHHGAELRIDLTRRNTADRLTTFVLSLPNE